MEPNETELEADTLQSEGIERILTEPEVLATQAKGMIRKECEMLVTKGMVQNCMKPDVTVVVERMVRNGTESDGLPNVPADQRLAEAEDQRQTSPMEGVVKVEADENEGANFRMEFTMVKVEPLMYGYDDPAPESYGPNPENYPPTVGNYGPAAGNYGPTVGSYGPTAARAYGPTHDDNSSADEYYGPTAENLSCQLEPASPVVPLVNATVLEASIPEPGFSMTAPRRATKKLKKTRRKPAKKVQPEKPDYYECDICRKHYKSKGGLRRHIGDHIGVVRPKNFKCHLCTREYETRVLLNTHVAHHLHIRAFQCYLCGKAYYSKGALRSHQASHNANPFVCVKCGKLFTTYTGLYVHNRNKHEGYKMEKRFPCDQCTKWFAYKDKLREHYRCHTGSKPFACVHCTKCFTHSSTLSRHLRIHTGEKPFSCDICQQKFNDSSSLKFHIRRHTGQKPFKCTHCEKAFTHVSNVKRHIKTHLEGKEIKEEGSEEKKEKKKSKPKPRGKRKPRKGRQAALAEAEGSFPHVGIHAAANPLSIGYLTNADVTPRPTSPASKPPR